VERPYRPARVIARYIAAQGDSDKVTRQRFIHRRLADIDQRAAGLKQRRDAAFDLYASATGGDDRPKMQARKLLREIENEEVALERELESVSAEASVVEADHRNAAEVYAALQAYAKEYARANTRNRNALNRGLCVMVGGWPTLRRAGRHRTHAVTIDWPEAEALLRPTRPVARVRA
jgi:hypothetical protein